MNKKTEEYLLELTSNRPQKVCKMCGRCCRAATTEFTYKELLEKQKQGDSQANDFLSIFEPYTSIQEAMSVEPEVVENIINSLKKSGKYDQNLTIYHCRYIGDDNRCGIYEKRPLVCRLAPLSPWSVFPPSCGFLPWLQQKKEEKIAQVKEQKRILIRLSELYKIVSSQEQKEHIQKCIDSANKIIESYKKYGSDIW